MLFLPFSLTDKDRNQQKRKWNNDCDGLAQESVDRTKSVDVTLFLYDIS